MSSKARDEISEVLGSLFEGIVKNQEDEAREKFGAVIEALKASPYGLKSAEHFNTMVMYQVKKVLGYAGLELAGQPADPKHKSAIKFLYTNYDFLEHQVRGLFQKLEGSSCCADKSRYILKIYKQYLLDGTIPADDFTERHYWIPRHGNHQDWLDLVKGAVELFYGDPQNYVETCNKIIKSEKRTYKAIDYKWYCTIDGKEYEVYETFDKEGSPFDTDGICVDEDYPGVYLIHYRGNELDKYESHPEHSSFHMVPIGDVTNIRHTEEEVDV
jgi:hypothetical protein